MRYVVIKKARQDEQQNYTTTTNIKYIQNFMSIFFQKKLKNNVKKASDKNETEQNNM